MRDLVRQYALQYNLDPDLYERQIGAESNFNPRAVSPAGAMGAGQLMPATAKSLGVANPFDVNQNLDGSARFMRQLIDQYGGNYQAALAHYNGGTRAGKAVMAGQQPPALETQNYLNKIQGGKMNYLPSALAARQNQIPGNELEIAGSGGEMKTYMLPAAIAQQYSADRQSRAANLPLALGAMLSGDKGISNVGSVLFADATAAQNPNKLNANMTLMPDGTVISTSDAQSSFYKALAGQVQQGKIDAQNLENGLSDSARNDPNAPWAGQPGKVEMPMRQAANKDAQKVIEDMRANSTKAQSALGQMDRFGQLNRETSTGSLVDQFLPDWARRGNSKEMITISNGLTPLARPEGSGATSDFEQRLYASAMPSVTNTGDVNANIRERYRVGAEISSARAKFYQSYLAKNGHINGADAAFEPMVKQFEAKYQHLLDPGKPAAPGNAPAAGGWKVEKG